MADLQFGTPVQYKAPEGMTLADMVRLAGGVQQLGQAAQLNPLQVEKANLELQQLKQTMPFATRKSAAEATTAELGANSAQLKNIQEHQANSSRNLIKLLNQSEPVTPEHIEQHVTETMKNAGASPQAIAQAVQNLPKSGTDKELRAFIAKHALNSLTAEAQMEKMFPASTFVQTGATITPVTTGNPNLATTAPGNIAGPSIEAQLPPSTEVVDPTTGERRMIGTLSQRNNAPLTTALGPAQAAAQAAVGETIKNDVAETIGDAKGAANRIATFQNIKRLTPEAFTGVGSERKKFLSGLAQSIGIPVAELETSTTDELAKNSKLLALSGGNTDAARQIAEMATPNAKMTKEALLRISDQLIGMEKMKLAKAAYLSSSINNPAEYKRKLDEFNNFSDFRLFQEMTPEEVAKLKASMSPAKQKEMGDKIKQARALGIIQ